MLVPGATGVGRYAEALADAQRAIGGRPLLLDDIAAPADRLGHYRAVMTGRSRTARLRSGPGGERLAGRHIFRSAQARFTWSGRITEVQADIGPGIMHWTYPIPVRMHGWINIYTIHDMIPVDRPDLSPVDPRRLSAILAAILPAADHVVTVSDDARGRIVARTGFDPARVTNISIGVGPEPAAAGALPAGLVAGGYFLFCGSVEPRKNIARLIAAHRRSGVVTPLVIAGPDGWRSAEMLDHPGGPVRRIPYLPRATMTALQRGAKALLFPSLAEGFGLPVIEAMVAGVPVLTSGAGALAETAGGAALLVDPVDEGALADAIARLDGNAALRATLAARGRIRATAFTPDRFAGALETVYSRAFAEHAANV